MTVESSDLWMTECVAQVIVKHSAAVSIYIPSCIIIIQYYTDNTSILAICLCWVLNVKWENGYQQDKPHWLTDSKWCQPLNVPLSTKASSSFIKCSICPSNCLFFCGYNRK